jgi:hypothetical protein
MITAATQADQSKYIFHELGCPYNGNPVCTASVSAMPLDNLRRVHCCNTENYDNCPIFLAKILRFAGKEPK